MILPSWYPVKNASCNVSRRRNLSETLFVWRNNLPYMKHLPEDFSVFSVSVLRTRHNNHWKLIYVSRTIPSSQYETNLWSTHVNIVRLTEPIRRCVCWRTQVFKIEGFVRKRFLPSPPPPPTFIFWLLFHFSRGQNRESRSSVFLYCETKRKRFLRRLRSLFLNRTETLATQATLYVAGLLSLMIRVNRPVYISPGMKTNRKMLNLFSSYTLKAAV